MCRMSRARALVFAADEDFGIVPVEAQATGQFFNEQSIAELTAAIEQFMTWEGRFEPQVIRRNAERFHRRKFAEAIQSFVNNRIAEQKRFIEG